MPQNKVAGKRQISTYLPEDVYEALLLQAAREKTTRSEIIERALRKELGMVRKIDIAVIECGEGWMDRLTGWEMYVADDATDEQILEQAIAEVEAAGYDVMRDADGGACEVTHHSDGLVVANITIRPLARYLRLTQAEFAKALGFETYEQLVAASEVVVTEGDVDWYVTPLEDVRWAAWDESELSLDRVAYFETREDAVQYHLDAARSAGIITEG